jgi:Zn-finger nucleic acid-binding protein
MPMHCPRDGSPLAAHIRGGIEIDHCPTCNGVWLDRGELDKLIAQAAPVILPEPRRIQPAPPPEHFPPAHEPRPEPRRAHFAPDAAAPASAHRHETDDRRDTDRHRDRDDDRRKRRKRGGFADFLEEIFDFD